ncbi:hypothetical protein CMT89_08305 [Elizabethkingia anophelis]|nr:hypothetical protein [Elizabethkingia anophelis]MDV3814197.1 hypothetical protein [Elizabethkingia anophelis]MDV3901191.1 hypothetical protein [Elizabethkingia anophelis]MDV4058431.1 hypothetical protein [Elizabethkingia anophelis]
MEGKAKEAFEKWFDNKYLDNWIYYNRPDNKTIINSLKIEWLDSVGIYIDIEFFRKNVKEEALFVAGTTDELNVFQPLGVEYHSRQEATEAAIKKAVEIFNEKYKENE